MFPMMGAGRATQRIEEEAERKRREEAEANPELELARQAEDLEAEGVLRKDIAKILGVSPARLRKYLPPKRR